MKLKKWSCEICKRNTHTNSRVKQGGFLSAERTGSTDTSDGSEQPPAQVSASKSSPHWRKGVRAPGDRAGPRSEAEKEEGELAGLTGSAQMGAY